MIWWTYFKLFFYETTEPFEINLCWTVPLIVLYIFFLVLIEEDFEDTKGVIIICISKKSRQHNGKKNKYKKTNNHLQSIHIKLKIE